MKTLDELLESKIQNCIRLKNEIGKDSDFGKQNNNLLFELQKIKSEWKKLKPFRVTIWKSDLNCFGGLVEFIENNKLDIQEFTNFYLYTGNKNPYNN